VPSNGRLPHFVQIRTFVAAADFRGPPQRGHAAGATSLPVFALSSASSTPYFSTLDTFLTAALVPERAVFTVALPAVNAGLWEDAALNHAGHLVKVVDEDCSIVRSTN
jgi:hypothetical protein